MELQDHGGHGHDKLMVARNQLLQMASQEPALTRVRHNGLDDSPQLQIDIDQRKAQALGVSLNDINSTLKTAWGSTYVNDFVDRGRVKKVYVQSEATARMLPEDVNKWYVRNKKWRHGAFLRLLYYPMGIWLSPPGALQRLFSTGNCR